MTDPSPSLVRSLRGMLFSMLLGFHNALEQDEAELDTLSGTFRLVQTAPDQLGHADLARTFIWGHSGLAN
jgi:hypothetical protein